MRRSRLTLGKRRRVHEGEAVRSPLDRASAYVDRGAILARLAADAHNAGDDVQGELFAREVECMVQGFDAMPAEDREFILWIAFSRIGRRARRKSTPQDSA